MTTRTLFRIVLLTLLLGATTALQAQSGFSLGTLQPGQLLLNLSASEQKEVDQDTLNAALQFTVQGRDKQDLQNRVNKAMSEALSLLRNQEAVEYTTGGYHVYIIEPGRASRSDIENPVWRAQQGLSLTSLDSEALLGLLGQLQEMGLEMTGLHYSLSSTRYEAETAAMLQSALSKLQRRAEEAAAGLGKSRAELIEVNLDGSPNMPGYFPREMAFRMSAADSSAMTAPAAEPGKSQVTLTVSARALLSP